MSVSLSVSVSVRVRDSENACLCNTVLSAGSRGTGAGVCAQHIKGEARGLIEGGTPSSVVEEAPIDVELP